MNRVSIGKAWIQKLWSLLSSDLCCKSAKKSTKEKRKVLLWTFNDISNVNCNASTGQKEIIAGTAAVYVVRGMMLKEKQFFMCALQSTSEEFVKVVIDFKFNIGLMIGRSKLSMLFNLYESVSECEHNIKTLVYKDWCIVGKWKCTAIRS